MRALIIVPVRDEADALEKLLPEVLGVISHLAPVPDIVVIDDGSSDGSGDVAERFGLTVFRQTGQGKPQAVRRGLEFALKQGYDATVIFDGDGQHPPEMIPAMLTGLRGPVITKGTRFHPDSPQHATPPDRRELCERIRGLVRAYTNWHITDPQCGLIAVPRQWLELVILALSWTIEWELELILWLRSVVSDQCPIHEVPIPALYEDLPGHKQVAKYDPTLGAARLAERLPRQSEVVHRTAARFNLLPPV